MQKIIAKIHLGNIRSNAAAFAALTGKKLCAVVKANAYGHGAEEVVNALEGLVDCFAVALIEEATAIRAAACGKDILVFTPPIDEEQCVAIAQNGFIATVPDLFTAKLLAATCRKYNLRARVHLKVNTGMNRYGMAPSMLGRVCSFFQTVSCVRVEGIYSHLYECQKKTALLQRQRFIGCLKICKRYFPNVTAHLSATYGALLGKDFSFDMTRVGLGLYGYLPDVPKREQFTLHLQKGMTVYATTVANRQYRYGGIGYGSLPKDWETQPPKCLSVCRCGYADGFLRKRKNGAHGQEKNANNLCMDVCIRADGKRRGQQVLLLKDADEIAAKTGTISYEVLCAATRRAEYVYDYE